MRCLFKSSANNFLSQLCVDYGRFSVLETKSNEASVYTFPILIKVISNRTLFMYISILKNYDNYDNISRIIKGEIYLAYGMRIFFKSKMGLGAGT